MVSAGRVTYNTDALRFDAERLCIGAHPADRCLGIMDQCWKSRLSAETILRCDRNVPKCGVGPDSFGQRILATAGKSSAVEVDRRHPFFSTGRRTINVQLQIHVAALAEDYVLLHSHAALT